MQKKKNKFFVYGLIAIFVAIISMGQVNADEYENYNGIKMTSTEYNTLLNLGFSEDEIYYMSEEVYLENKDLDATLVAENEKYYKTIYTDLAGNSYSTEITEEEYENQASFNARGVVETEYKRMVTTISQNSDKFRYKVSVSWKNMPSKRNYDIIGVGFEDNVYINSPVHYYSYWCNSYNTCNTDTSYAHKKSTSTGGAVTFDFPDSAISLSATLYYDVSKNTSNTITRLTMYGDYAHAISNVSSSNVGDYYITHNGLELFSNIVGKFDAIPTAPAIWNGTW